ncbi:MAG: 1-deoxy-D-xylulose-5-phosphate reductoisomerase, partial [Verrucomicrobia bacterium]
MSTQTTGFASARQGANADELGPRKRVVLLGATGSIGESTLRVLRAHGSALELVGVAAHGSGEKLFAIAREFGVRHVALFDVRAATNACKNLPPGVRLHAPGIEGLEALATLPEADVVLVAVVGTAGLRPALAALAAGKDLALASKEILVLAGGHVRAAAKKSGAKLLPVDSEHNAVYQCLQGHAHAELRRVILTASGGAFRDWPVERLGEATVADALKHPNWSMGPKITVDSATLANKGLELIEAAVLFDLRPEQCAAIIHPQSIVHCLVEFTDGAMLAQLCPPSMTFPIQHALLHPERGQRGTDHALSLDRVLNLEFRPADEGRFPM